jgi:hypothetical protein
MNLPISYCPTCKYEMDQATNVYGGGVPDKGAFSVCLNCGQLLIFSDDLTLRKPTLEEIIDVIKDKPAWRMIEKAQHIIQQRGLLHVT